MWNDIENEYREIRATLYPFRVPSKAEWDLHTLSILTYRKVESPLTFGPLVPEPVYSVDAARRSSLRSLSYELGYLSDLPDDWQPFADHPPPINYDLIAQCIEEQTHSLAFVREWGRLKELHAQFIELVHRSDRAHAETEQSIAGAAEGHRIQHYWYAHWIRRRSSTLKPRDRRPAERELARVCFEVANRILRAPPPYNREWYGKILDERAGSAAEQIKSSYQNLSARKLRELLSDARIVEKHLPPLSVEAFRPR